MFKWEKDADCSCRWSVSSWGEFQNQNNLLPLTTGCCYINCNLHFFLNWWKIFKSTTSLVFSLNWFLFLGPPDQKLAVKKHKTFLAPKDCTCDFTYYVIFLFICHYCMIITTWILLLESFSCSPGWYFGTFFWDVTMFWDENLLYTIIHTYFLFQLRKIYCQNKFSSQNIVISC